MGAIWVCSLCLLRAIIYWIGLPWVITPLCGAESGRVRCPRRDGIMGLPNLSNGTQSNTGQIPGTLIEVLWVGQSRQVPSSPSARNISIDRSMSSPPRGESQLSEEWLTLALRLLVEKLEWLEDNSRPISSLGAAPSLVPRFTPVTWN